MEGLAVCCGFRSHQCVQAFGLCERLDEKRKTIKRCVDVHQVYMKLFFSKLDSPTTGDF